jgi:hypothetical protein
MYAVLYRENICLHLQWHADTPNDPLLGGSVIRIYVKNITALFNELEEYFKKFGFKHIETELSDDGNWGDAIFARK